MNELESSQLDTAVRDTLEAAPETADRIARAALAEATPLRRRALAPLVLVLAAAGGVWVALSPTAQAPVQPSDSTPGLRIVNHGGVVSAVDPSRVSLAVHTVDRRPEAPRRLIIVRGGDS